MSKILIIEDDYRLAEIIRRGLEEQGHDAQAAFDGRMGLKMALSNPFDLIISDIVLPEMNGLDLCRKIKLNKPSVPVLMLTALGATDDKLEGFDAGADDYLTKPFELRELQARVRVLMKRYGSEQGSSDAVLTYDEIEVNPSTKTAIRAGKEIKLTPREFHLLEFLVKNPQRVLSRSEISERVWNTPFDTGTNFIDVYINYLRKKIDKPFDRKLIHTRPGMGFILSNQENQ